MYNQNFLWMRQKEKDLFSFERKNIMINLELLTRWLQETSILNVWHFFVRGKYVYYDCSIKSMKWNMVFVDVFNYAKMTAKQ